MPSFIKIRKKSVDGRADIDSGFIRSSPFGDDLKIPSPYLQHCVTIGVGYMDFQTGEVGLIVMLEIEILQAKLGVLDFHFTIALWHNSHRGRLA